MPAEGFAAIVLAAGSGSRLGHRPKGLLERDGVPLVRRVVSALVDGGAGDCVVVTGHHAGPIEAALVGAPARCLRNPRPEEGQVSSTRLGLAAITGDATPVMVALADLPLLEPTDVAALWQAWTQRPAGAEVMVPWVDGRRGHPVVLSGMVRAAVLADAAGPGPRAWQDAHPKRVAPFHSARRAYVVDIDTPEDLAQLARDGGPTLRWPAPWGD